MYYYKYVKVVYKKIANKIQFLLVRTYKLTQDLINLYKLFFMSLKIK
jgi:hypothetical protein